MTLYSAQAARTRALSVEQTVKWLPLDDAYYLLAEVMTSTRAAPLVVLQEVLLQVEAHATAAAYDSACGVLCGAHYRDSKSGLVYLLVESAERAERIDPTGNPDASLAAELARAIARAERAGRIVVGWYRFDVALARRIPATDAGIHRALFPEPWQVALLRDGSAGGGRGAFVRVEPTEGRPFRIPFLELIPRKRSRGRGPKWTSVQWRNYGSESAVALLPDHVFSDAPARAGKVPVPNGTHRTGLFSGILARWSTRPDSRRPASAAIARPVFPHVPVERATVERANGEHVPGEHVPVEHVPVEDLPVEDLPVEDVPVERATVGEEQAPLAGEPAPLAHKPGPVAEESELLVEEQTPLAEKQSPLVEEQAPLMEEQTPLAEEPEPLVEAPPALAESSPSLIEESSSLIESSPSLIEDSPSLIEEPPSQARESPSAIESSPPAAEEPATLPDVHDEPPATFLEPTAPTEELESVFADWRPEAGEHIVDKPFRDPLRWPVSITFLERAIAVAAVLTIGYLGMLGVRAVRETRIESDAGALAADKPEPKASGEGAAPGLGGASPASGPASDGGFTPEQKAEVRSALARVSESRTELAARLDTLSSALRATRSSAGRAAACERASSLYETSLEDRAKIDLARAQLTRLVGPMRMAGVDSLSRRAAELHPLLRDACP